MAAYLNDRLNFEKSHRIPKPGTGTVTLSKSIKKIDRKIFACRLIATKVLKVMYCVPSQNEVEFYIKKEFGSCSLYC